MKSLTREDTTISTAFHPYITFVNLRASRPNWPSILNPIYGAIHARHVRTKSGYRPFKTASNVQKRLFAQSGKHGVVSPDLIVAGIDIVCLPCIDENDETTFHSPFYIEGKSKLWPQETLGLAFAIGVCSLLYALDTTILAKMPWPKIIADGTGFPSEQ